MIKTILTIALTIGLAFSTNAQEKYQVTRVDGYGVKFGKIFFTIDEGHIQMTAKGKPFEEEYVIVLDTEKQLVFDVVGGLNKIRYTLTRNVSNPSIQYQTRDSFSGETTSSLWIIKKVK
tara:strand:+ start:54 stop:410 length:357 start_codon:yes stop_codon:yes gene_type:complete